LADALVCEIVNLDFNRQCLREVIHNAMVQSVQRFNTLALYA
jgi:hypothetical protein